MDFGFARYDLNQITQRIELPEISPDAAKPLTLIVRCTLNRDFANALFKALPPAPQPATAGEADQQATALVPAEDETAARLRMATLYAGNVVVDWENVTLKGEPVPFGVEAAVELLSQLMLHCPDIWSARVRDYVAQVGNFRPTAQTVDPVDLGKGSPRG